MIKYIFFLFLLSVGLFSPQKAIASGGFIFTHTTPTLELKPTSSLDDAYRTAGVCFLGVGDCDSLNDYAVDSKNQCLNEGFTATCPPGYHPEVGKDCIHNPDYKKCCKENCPTNASVDCTGAETGSDGCGYTCKKCCVTSCPSGSTYSTIPNGYVKDGEACMHCTQGNLYKVKANPCDGFSTCPYGPASGASTCLSGTTTKYSSCRPCTASCPSGTSENDPGGCGGKTRNECDTKNCFYAYQACCSDECPSYRSSGKGDSCSYGSETCYDSCGGGWWHNCKPAPAADPCDSVTAVGCGSLGCKSYHSSCSSKCQTCNSAPASNPCDSVTAVSCGSLGCKSYHSSCSSKCQTCNPAPVANPCDSVTAVSVPSNASCSSYHSSCSSKCSGWSCNSGYSKSGSSCVKDKPACTPSSNETGCSIGTKNCDNGCGGTRQCCKYCGDVGLSSSCGTYEKCNKSSTYSGCGTCVSDSCKVNCNNAQQIHQNTGLFNQCMYGCGTSIHC